MTRPTQATISYESFSELWKRLVSKKKARKYDVDRDLLWSQLAAGLRVELRKADDDAGKAPRADDGEPAHRPAARQAAAHVHGHAVTGGEDATTGAPGRSRAVRKRPPAGTAAAKPAPTARAPRTRTANRRKVGASK